MSPLASILTLRRLFSSEDAVALSELWASAAVDGLTVNTLNPSDGTAPRNNRCTPSAPLPSTCTGTASPVEASTTLTDAAAAILTVASMGSARAIETGLYTTSGTPAPVVSSRDDTALVELVSTPAN